MVKVNYFHQGFVGKMQTKECKNKDETKQFLEENKNKINILTATIKEI